jgi:hypothetical protein
VETLRPGPLARVLESGRRRYNARFERARHGLPHLDPGRFAAHLAATLAPVVEAVDRARPDRTVEVVNVLYDLSLELVGRDLLGPAARFPSVDAGWRRVLTAVPDLLVADAHSVAGAAVNALQRIAAVPGARPAAWADRMAALGEACRTPEDFLAAGPVAAWTAGMAHYREGALAIARRLAPPLAAAALGVVHPPEDLAAFLDRLAADPWLDPAAAGGGGATRRALRVVGRIGAFRGFGGPFLRPPRVACAGGRIVASDGEGAWTLHADRFGSVLLRAEAVPGPEDGTPAPFALDARTGRVRHGDRALAVPELAVPASAASDGVTLAATTARSHAIVLVAAA